MNIPTDEERGNISAGGVNVSDQHSSAPVSPPKPPDLPVEVHIPDDQKADADTRMAALRAVVHQFGLMKEP